MTTLTHYETVDGQQYLVLRLPIATQSEANAREHWAAKAKRVKAQHDAVAWQLCTVGVQGIDMAQRIHGAAVRLVRVAPRQLDGDNLQGSLKAVRDAVAQWLYGGRVGQHDGRCEWVYDQRRGLVREYAVEVWLPC